MRDVVLLSAASLLLLLGGLLLLALPDPYEGGVLYSIDVMHAVRVLDLTGLGLVLLGVAAAWWAGTRWQRQVHGGVVTVEEPRGG